MSARITDEEIISSVQEIGVTRTAIKFGINVRGLQRRIKKLEIKIGEVIQRSSQITPRYARRYYYDIPNGVAVIGSDCHYLPGRITTAHRGLVHLSKELQASVVCLNGDVTNGTKNSKHDPIMWEGPKPNVRQELEVVDERLQEIKDANPNARIFWTLGNHDARFESKLSAKVPEYEGVQGMALSDHFPGVEIAWSLWLNAKVVVKHRFKGGIHATFQNTLWAGMSIVTGHLHSLRVTPFTDYSGTRFGVDTGTLEEPNGPHAEYTEENPLNHRSGFVVLTFHNGEMLWPEIAAVHGPDEIQFRGKIIRV